MVTFTTMARRDHVRCYGNQKPSPRSDDDGALFSQLTSPSSPSAPMLTNHHSMAPSAASNISSPFAHADDEASDLSYLGRDPATRGELLKKIETLQHRGIYLENQVKRQEFELAIYYKHMAALQQRLDASNDGLSHAQVSLTSANATNTENLKLLELYQEQCNALRRHLLTAEERNVQQLREVVNLQDTLHHMPTGELPISCHHNRYVVLIYVPGTTPADLQAQSTDSLSQAPGTGALSSPHATRGQPPRPRHVKQLSSPTPSTGQFGLC